MNITTALPTIPTSPMPASEFVGRDNQQRSLITESPASAENGSATDKKQSSQDSSKAERTSERQDSRPAENKQESERTPREQQQIQQEVRELESRDTEVRNHEQAHAAVGGQYAGSPSYEYERGPNGKSYAVGGEVPIDISVVPGDPQATIQKMTVVRRAALAPAEPSAADRSIAAEASTKASQARAELAQQNNPVESERAENSGSDNESKVQGPVTKSLEGQGDGKEASSDSEPSVSSERKTLSAPERGEMIASFYQQRVSPSETGFAATA
ncbi:putative metalloprotease CJM1_0395 family protein [Idiomarina seosinensis]|nr:putative metalloprotease CJM1_0395 family protein [Idiomarina seosinensis]